MLNSIPKLLIIFTQIGKRVYVKDRKEVTTSDMAKTIAM